MDLNYSAEETAFRDEVRGWLEQNLPHDLRDKVRDYKELSKDDLERWHKILARKGWVAPDWPVQWGGTGWNVVQRYIFEEECGYAGTPPLVAFGLRMCAPVLFRFGTEAQKQRYLVPLARGETFAGTAVTEPHSGTDVAAMETTVVRRGDEYVLNGSKIWISGVGLAEWYLTFATLDRAKGARGVCAFVVERGFPGFSERPIRHKLAFRPAQVGELVFEDCRVPAENLVGREGEGLKVALCAVENGRLSVACRAVGLAQGCLDASVGYARQRVVQGQPIARYQLVQAKIADMVLGIESARYLTYRLAWLKAQGVRRARRESSIAKLYASEMAFRAASDAVQIHGAYGASEEYAVGRFLRDAKFLQVVEGVNDIHRVLVGEYALGLREDPR